MPQVISILSATLARCDAHYALLARCYQSNNRVSVRFAGVPTMYSPASSRVTFPSALRPRCITKISHAHLGNMVPRVPARPSVPCFSKVHGLRSERASATARKYTRNSLPLARAANAPQPFSTCYGLKGPTGSSCKGKLSQPQPLQGEPVFSPCSKRKHQRTGSCDTASHP